MKMLYLKRLQLNLKIMKSQKLKFIKFTFLLEL